MKLYFPFLHLHWPSLPSKDVARLQKHLIQAREAAVTAWLDPAFQHSVFRFGLFAPHLAAVLAAPSLGSATMAATLPATLDDFEPEHVQALHATTQALIQKINTSGSTEAARQLVELLEKTRNQKVLRQVVEGEMVGFKDEVQFDERGRIVLEPGESFKGLTLDRLVAHRKKLLETSSKYQTPLEGDLETIRLAEKKAFEILSCLLTFCRARCPQGVTLLIDKMATDFDMVWYGEKLLTGTPKEKAHLTEKELLAALARVRNLKLGHWQSHLKDDSKREEAFKALEIFLRLGHAEAKATLVKEAPLHPQAMEIWIRFHLQSFKTIEPFLKQHAATSKPALSALLDRVQDDSKMLDWFLQEAVRRPDLKTALQNSSHPQAGRLRVYLNRPARPIKAARPPTAVAAAPVVPAPSIYRHPAIKEDAIAAPLALPAGKTKMSTSPLPVLRLPGILHPFISGKTTR